MTKELKQLEEQHRRVIALCLEADLATIGIEGVRNKYQKNEALRSKPGYSELRAMLEMSILYHQTTRS
jgi:hypothetical protein